jgi:hypothetical protein
MSAWGVKRIWRLHCEMSANDPKLIFESNLFLRLIVARTMFLRGPLGG